MNNEPELLSMNKKMPDDCCANEAALLPHEEALQKLTCGLKPVEGVREIDAVDAAGAVLAKPIYAPRNIPAHNHSAVDGYGFRFADYDRETGSTLPVRGRAAAGSPLEGKVVPGSAIRIFTGASVPDGIDTVIMQEDTEQVECDGQIKIKLAAGLDKGANIRLAGEDVRAGATVLSAHRRLRPQDLGAIASTGISKITCYRPLNVAIFSTGDEVIRPGTPFQPGKVYDSNAAMLRALITAGGARCHDLGVLPDTPDMIREQLAKAAENHDILMTSGGVSVGELDHIPRILNELGSIHQWKVAIKPGKPVSFGQIGNCRFLGLPGNPVAAFLCFLLYAHPVITILSGETWRPPRRFALPALFSMNKKPGRREFLRGILKPDEAGRLQVAKFDRDGSGLISSLTKSDGFIELDEETTRVEAGEMVNFIPFSAFGLQI